MPRLGLRVFSVKIDSLRVTMVSITMGTGQSISRQIAGAYQKMTTTSALTMLIALVRMIRLNFRNAAMVSITTTMVWLI
jgi:hypothetical protein